jgi:hypothetical protein
MINSSHAYYDFFHKSITKWCYEIRDENESYYENFPFELLNFDLRTFISGLLSYGFDDIDYIHDVVKAIFSPHLLNFRSEDQAYIIHILSQSNSDQESRVNSLAAYLNAKKNLTSIETP